jgi:membrane-associated phospholipid phosphatase
LQLANDDGILKMRTHKPKPPSMCVSLVLCTCCLAASPPVFAQTPAAPPVTATDATSPSSPSPAGEESFSGLVRDIARDFTQLPSSRTARFLALGATTAAMATSGDRHFSNWMSARGTLSGPLEPGNILGGFQMQGGAALATYTIGRLTNQPRVTAVGADLVRAHVLSQTVTGVFKFSARRTRPDGTRLSFPSGHTSATFATATVLQQHFGWKVGVPAMAMAGYVAAARIQKKRHYPSDVVFGAMIGIAAGRTVTVGRGRAQFAVAPMAAPQCGGVSFTWIGQ